MDNQVPKYYTQARASLLLGMPEAELDRISKESGLGHEERAGNEKETYFTSEELQRICEIAGRPIETVHLITVRGFDDIEKSSNMPSCPRRPRPHFQLPRH